MPNKLPIVEFVALMALMMSTVAFAIDAMLPGLPQIASELSPDFPNRAQLVVTFFMLGLGFGTFVVGALADAYGRKIVVGGGLAIFIIGDVLAYYADSMELLLAARALQGLGVAGPRIAPLAMIRDLYEGRKMAQITSFITMVFMIVPALAPAFGAVIIDGWGWRALFIAFIIFACIGSFWLLLRQPETLIPENRRPLHYATLKSGFLEIVTNRAVIVYTGITTLGFATLISMLSSTQQIYTDTFGRGDTFPLWFGLTALVAATGTILNAYLVVRVGMRRLVMWAFAILALVSLVVVAVFISGTLSWQQSFPIWFFWSATNLFMVGLTLGNLNALALQPLGHIAGLGASIIIAVSTVLAVFIGGPVGLAFDGTPIPLIASVCILAGLAWLATWRATRENY